MQNSNTNFFSFNVPLLTTTDLNSSSNSGNGIASLNTTSAAQLTLLSVQIPSNTSGTIFGWLSAMDALHTDATGGNFLATFINNAGTLSIVGSPVINLNATSTGTFTVDASGVNARVRITAPSVASYNWNCNYFFIFNLP